MALWRRASLGCLLLHLRLRAALALHLHDGGSGEGEGDLPMGQDELFGQLQAALRAAQASLVAQGRSASDVRAALRRVADPADSGSRASGHEGAPEDGRIPAKNARGQGVSTLLQDEVEMLSDSQKEMLEAIQNRSVGKDQIEIVLAHYNESVGWSRMYEHIITPYCKGDCRPSCRATAWTPRDCRQLPNVGRETHTFLHHIVKNYDKLADWTVFTQAQPPTVGYTARAGDTENGHMLPGVTFHDYVLGGGPFSGDGGDSTGARFIFNGQWKPQPPERNPDGAIRLCFAGNYFLDDFTLGHGPPKRLNNSCPRLKSIESHLWLGVDSVNQALKAFIDAVGASSERKFYYSQGARFALSRERIRQRPRQFYQKLLGTVDSEVYPMAGVFAEMLWYYIPGKPGQHRQPCTDHAQACPEGFDQLGGVADHAELGTLQRLRVGSMAECAAACNADRSCESFEFHAHHPKLCVLQPAKNSAEKAQTGFWPGAVACRRTGARRT